MGRKLKFKNFLFDLISFGNSQAIAINLVLIIVILFLMPTSELHNLPVRSVYGSFVVPVFFNNTCSSSGIFANCGFYSIGQTRAMSMILHGNFEEAYGMNKLVYLLLFALIAVLAVNLYKSYKFYKKTGKIFPW